MSADISKPALPVPVHNDVVGQFRKSGLIDDLEAGRRERRLARAVAAEEFAQERDEAAIR
jgi:hypothetical protein